MGLSLTARDVDVLRYIGGHRLVRLADLAALFFARDPRNGRPSAHGLDASARRLRALAAARVVDFHSIDEDDARARVVGLGSRADLVPDLARRSLPAVRSRSHHLRTGDVVRHLADQLARRGMTVVDVRYDQDLRAAALRGKRTRQGDRHPAFPDAVVVVEKNDGSGRRIEAAVEYVTSKYTDADIRRKAASFRTFRAVVWMADSANTARRVERLTGAVCKVAP